MSSHRHHSRPAPDPQAAADFETWLERQRRRVEAALDRWLPPEDQPPQIIHRAMRYSVFAGGKRIRPILCLASAEAVGSEAPGVMEAACALELVHTYSLIHDDLPALDNDDFRRGRPTCHKQFGEAMAILAGDALLTLAFHVLARAACPDGAARARLVEEISAAAGTPGGMIAGQVEDLEGQGRTPTAELLETIHRAKTGALLTASVRMGAICAGAGEEQLEALTRYGRHVGLAFQIVDDLLDVEQSTETLGKTAGKDARQKKITFPAVYGLPASHRMAEQEITAALREIESFGERARRLRELALLVLNRSK
ncbi:MAG: polyprenyl synthetase family protein [Bryobacterales bacterium]|nr:polyprenyl synthetase family protein [Bryobacteraceae bacterium]MDW8129532.1 polyprenyl synthetase family protein [Bryobacterales bacterium]